VAEAPVAQNPAPQLADLASQAANLASQGTAAQRADFEETQHVSSPEHPTYLPE